MKFWLSNFLKSVFIKETKALLVLAIPIVIGQVGQNLIQLADTMMVGPLGPLALSASAFAGSVFIVFLIFGMGILAPTTALFAQIRGKKNFAEGGHLLLHNVALAIAISLVLVLGLNFILVPNLDKFGQTPEVLSFSIKFFKIITWSILPSMIYQAYKQFTDGVGKAKVAMSVMILGVIVNIPGNYILIHGLYGFPKMGINGSAWATLFVRTLMALTLVIYVHVNKSFSEYLKEKWTFKFEFAIFKKILRLGIPTGFFYLFEVGAFSAASVMMGWFGAVPLAAHQITLTLASTSFLVTLGIGIAASIRVGFERGRQNFEAARFAGFTAIQVGAVYMTFCAFIFFFFRNWFPTLYINDSAVISWAAQFFIVVAFFEIFDGVQAVSMGALRGFSDTKGPGFIAFFAYWIMGLPIGYLIAFKFNGGPVGIWYGLLIGLFFAALLLTWRFHQISSRFIKQSLVQIDPKN